MIKRSNLSDGRCKMVSIMLKIEILNKLSLMFFAPTVDYVRLEE